MHPLIPLIQKTYAGYFKTLDIEYSLSDEHINEPYLTIQGTKPSKKGQTIYAMTFKISELEDEMINGEGLDAYLTKNLAGVFETKDVSDYWKVK